MPCSHFPGEETEAKFSSWEVVQPEFQPQLSLALEPVPCPLFHAASKAFLGEEKHEQA